MVTSPTYGSCYSINSNLSGLAEFLWQSSLPGPNLGLTIELNLDQQQYMRNGLTKSAGARVTFHNSSFRPLVDEFGHDIQPSTSTNFALEAGIFTRMESPYDTDCFPSWSQTNYSTQFLNSTKWPYSFMQCKRFCVFDAVMQDCGCFHPLYLDIDDTRGGHPPCDLSDSEVDTCIMAIMNQFSGAQRSCPCNQSCYETEYTAAVSSSVWPAKQYEGILSLSYGFISPPSTTTEDKNCESGDVSTSDAGPTLANNLLQINVYFDTLSEQAIETKATYGGSALTSGIGGVLSLFLGISIAMVFEIVELFLDFLGNLLNWSQGKPLGRKHMKF